MGLIINPDVIIDTNMLLHPEKINFSTNKDYDQALTLIKPEFIRMLDGLEPLYIKFILTPAVAYEILFEGRVGDPNGMSREKAREYSKALNVCYLTTVDKVDVSDSNLSNYIYAHHEHAISELTRVFYSCHRAIKYIFGVDVYVDTAVNSRIKIYKYLQEDYVESWSVRSKESVFDRIVGHLHSHNLMCNFDEHESIKLSGMSILIMCIIFKIDYPDPKSKFPFRDEKTRRNFMCDFMVFYYGFISKNAVVLTGDTALAKRGNLILKALSKPEIFISASDKPREV